MVDVWMKQASKSLSYEDEVRYAVGFIDAVCVWTRAPSSYELWLREEIGLAENGETGCWIDGSSKEFISIGTWWCVV